MRIVLFVLLAFLYPTSNALALSCLPPKPEDVIARADLIAHAEVQKIKPVIAMPLVSEHFNKKDIITFKILAVYKGDKGLNDQIIKVRFSGLVKDWGPTFKQGDKGDYLFYKDEKSGEWVYQGPGGCTWLDPVVWEKLKAVAE